MIDTEVPPRVMGSADPSGPGRAPAHPAGLRLDAALERMVEAIVQNYTRQHSQAMRDQIAAYVQGKDGGRT